MKKASVADAESWFQVLFTSMQTQVAVMRLEPGGASSEQPSVHAASDQVLLVVEGSVDAEVGGERARLEAGDAVVVPAGTRHQFRCAGLRAAVTFNVYGPPAYDRRTGVDPDERASARPSLA